MLQREGRVPHIDAHEGHIERRNYPARAETLCRVLRNLLNDSTDVTTWAPDEAAERILRRLACRGLVRRVSGTWLPTPILLHPAALIPCSEASV